MHGLPKDFDASVFVGATIETVTFTVNTIHLAFDTALAITAQRHLRYRISSAASLEDDEVPVTNSGLMAMVGRVVESAEIRGPGDLILGLEGGSLILVEDDSQHYESYTLTTPEGEVFV
jgi:hypothetical protein